MSNITAMSREGIEKLKEAWLDDPCWDIECTEGFEAHEEELLKFRIECEQQWEQEQQEHLIKESEVLGIPMNLIGDPQATSQHKRALFHEILLVVP